MCGCGGVHGRGYAWWGGACVAEGACVAGGHAWQERRPLQWAIRILLECILVSKMFLKCYFFNELSKSDFVLELRNTCLYDYLAIPSLHSNLVQGFYPSCCTRRIQ